MTQPPAPPPVDPTQGGYAVPSAYPSARPPFTLTLGDVLVGGGGLLIVLFSFAPFVSSEDNSFGVDDSWSAWAAEVFMAPLTWWVIFAGLLLIALAVSRMFWPPQREFFGFRPTHLQVGLSLFAFFVLLGYALSDKGGFLEFGWGGVIMLLGSIVAVAGAVLNHLGIGPTLLPQGPKAPAGYGAPGQYPPPQAPQG
jgi:uncharacterized membrane protein